MKNTLLNACINNGNGDLFTEIKKLRNSSPTITSTIDGVCEDIPNHFASIYNNLYNSVMDQEEISDIQLQLNGNIRASSVIEVRKVTPSLIAEAVSHLKSGKNDPVFAVTSDCLKNAPLLFYEHLAILFKNFLMHDHVSSILMLSTVIPLLKDKLGDICASDNYRSIAISSQILKVLDWVIVLLYGDKLDLDQLQFGYQSSISTSMCTWLAVETIDYFMRNESNVYVCTMDMSKAFDKVKHSLLFRKLMKRDIPEIYIKLLVRMYSNQSAKVRWNNIYSQQFSISNGVKQGAVLSAILYCVYVNDLYRLLRKKKYGCWVRGEYCGVVGYSDDILLLAPSINALKEMIKTCEDYANVHNLQFSTHANPNKSKTKCIAFLRQDTDLQSIELCGNELPWVKDIKHLGSSITNDPDVMARDIMQKRAAYINRNNELRQEFYYADATSKITTNSYYNTSFYGSVLWNLFSVESLRLEKSWNISLRKMLHLPYNSHRYFMEPISNTRHILTSLYSRFVKFVEKLKLSKKTALQTMLNNTMYDCQSNTGRILRRIMLKIGKNSVNNISTSDIHNIVYNEIPNGSEWTIGLVKEIISGQFVVPGFDRHEIYDILNYVCSC